MSKRGNGEGSVYKRADGRWEARVTVGYRDGRRVRKAIYGKTRGEVQDRLATTLQRVRDGVPVTMSERTTVGAFLQAWLRSTRQSVRGSTFVTYEGHVRRHLIPALGRIPLTRLTPQHVRDLLAERQASHLSARSVQQTHSVLRQALNQAARDGLVARNVAALVTPPRVRRTEMTPLTPDGARRLLSVAQGHRLEALYTVAVAVGLRHGEALGLRWQDVDMDTGVLRVTHTLHRVPKMLRGPEDGGRGSRYVLAEPKTDRSRRTVGLPRFAIEALRQHRLRQLKERVEAGPAWQEQGLVFTTTIGTPLDCRNVTRGFQRMLEAEGLPRMRFHDLRHSAATLMLAEGVSARVIMETLGHSEIGTTMNLYAHVLPMLQREAADRMDDVFRIKAEAS